MTAAATLTDPTVVPRVIGCDVGKKSITIFDTATGRTTELANHADALLAFAQGLPPDCLVVCEATGGYEAALLMATAAAGVSAHRADARKVKAFIRSLGRLGKASMPEGSLAMAKSATPNCRAGNPSAGYARICAPSSASEPNWSSSEPR